jgi:hypothetical protein
MLSIVLSVKSFYVLVSEPKTKTLISPGFLRTASMPKVSEWIKASHNNFDEFIDYADRDKTISIEADFVDGAPIDEDENEDSIKQDDDDYQSAKDDYHEESLSLSKRQGRKGFTHRSNHNTALDSFDDHLKDVQDPKDKHFKDDFDEVTKQEEKHENLILDTEPNSQEWWNQNLILIVEILRTNASVIFYRNEGLKTEAIFKIFIYPLDTFNIPKRDDYNSIKFAKSNSK